MTCHRLLPLTAALSLTLLSAPSLWAAPAAKPAAKTPAVAATPRLIAAVKVADSVRVLPPVATTLPAAAPSAPAASIVADTAPAASGAADEYTGILIDARQLPGILRSPAPAIYGPGPDSPLLYPDRSHVPTPDEVQDESIVRYYHTPNEAEAGVAGSHPLILPATAVLGYAKDALQLSAEDMVRLQDLEKKLHFTQTWKVGFLIPAGQ
jgi:hypothetical protein